MASVTQIAFTRAHSVRAEPPASKRYPSSQAHPLWLPWRLRRWRICLQCGRPGFSPGVREIPGGGSGYPLQYSCLENPTDRGARQAAVHGLQRVGHDWAADTSTLIILRLQFFRRDPQASSSSPTRTHSDLLNQKLCRRIPVAGVLTSPPGDSDACSSLRTVALRHNGLSLHQCPGIFWVTDIKYDSGKILAAEYICLFNCMQNACQEGFREFFLRRRASFLLPALHPSLWRLYRLSIQAPILQAILKTPTPALFTWYWRIRQRNPEAGFLSLAGKTDRFHYICHRV